jgi:hypothetical protein
VYRTVEPSGGRSGGWPSGVLGPGIVRSGPVGVHHRQDEVALWADPVEEQPRAVGRPSGAHGRDAFRREQSQAQPVDADRGDPRAGAMLDREGDRSTVRREIRHPAPTGRLLTEERTVPPRSTTRIEAPGAGDAVVAGRPPGPGPDRLVTAQTEVDLVAEQVHRRPVQVPGGVVEGGDTVPALEEPRERLLREVLASPRLPVITERTAAAAHARPRRTTRT